MAGQKRRAGSFLPCVSLRRSQWHWRRSGHSTRRPVGTFQYGNSA